jgi:hypothetical protein
MLVACLSIAACERQKLTQIPHPPQGKQFETLQATASASSGKWTLTKWTLKVGVIALLWWNWREKVYYRARTEFNEKFIVALNTWKRDPNKQVDPVAVNAAYTDAFAAVNDFIWECEPDEFEDFIELRDLVCQYMSQDAALTDDTKESNIADFNQAAVMLYPNRIDRLFKFKQDVGGWIWKQIKRLRSRD